MSRRSHNQKERFNSDKEILGEEELNKLKRKQLMHGLRVARMINELLDDKTLHVKRTDDAQELLDVKHGKRDMDSVYDEIDALIAIIDEKYPKSDFKQSADLSIFNPLIVSSISKYWMDKAWI